MKKINSIGYGHKIIGTAGVFIVVIPLCCYALNSIFRIELFSKPMYISLAIGIIIMLFFIGLLCVELRQDGRIERRYSRITSKTKIALGSGVYECQACGNRQVNNSDKSCNVCGLLFSQEAAKC